MSTPTSATGTARSTSSPSTTPTPTSSRSSSSSSSSVAPRTHTVKAGAGGFKFEPQELKDVNVGDTVSFEFYPPDHSVARAEYLSPCVPYEYTGKDKVGFWSETQWVKTVNDLTHYNLKINNTDPIFYYCAAPKSCTEQHMVGAIFMTGSNGTQTLDAQIKAAEKATFQVTPGEPMPGEGSSTTTNSATGAPSTGSSSGHHSLSGGAIAGIVVGAVAFLAICAALFFFVGRTKSLKEMVNRKDATVTKTSPPDNYRESQYGGSQYPGSPGFAPASPYSPNMQQAEYGGQLPVYGQHNATDQHPTGWASPQPSVVSPQMGEHKFGYQPVPVELASPPPQQQTFTAELEAPAAKTDK